jgi:hypothetical protein
MSSRAKFKTVQQHQEFARAYIAGATLKQSLIRAGYSAAQARKGIAILNKSQGLRRALVDQARLLIELGRAFRPEEQDCLVRGRLIYNTLLGIDKGTASAKALRSEKRVSMWQVDGHAGMVVLQVPANGEKLLAAAKYADE